MQLWILKPIDVENDRHWNPWYDKTFALVVRAENEQLARQFAAEETKYEDEAFEDDSPATSSVWVDATRTSCEQLGIHGDAGVIIRDKRNA